MDVSQHFTDSFASIDLTMAIDSCAQNELAQRIVTLPGPVLEAGCGSGKWMHYLKRLDVDCVGIDWSQELMTTSRAYDPAVRFDVGDLRKLPYPDARFGSVMALGSIEHVPEGPGAILREFHRVLVPGGRLLATVPFRSWLKRPRQTLRQSGVLRRAFHRVDLPAAPSYRTGIFANVDAHDGFYQYEFSASQLQHELEESGFRVHELFPFAKDYGLLAAFGGSFNPTTEQATPRSKFLRLLPDRIAAHMLGATATRL